MSFRKNNNEDRIERLNWEDFCKRNRRLMERIGLTTPTFETEDRFRDFLLHGYIDHHDDWSEYSVRKMNEEQYELFKVLIGRYLDAGYDALSMMAISRKELIEFAKKYPQKFQPYVSCIEKNQDE